MARNRGKRVIGALCVVISLGMASSAMAMIAAVFDVTAFSKCVEHGKSDGTTTSVCESFSGAFKDSVMFSVAPGATSTLTSTSSTFSGQLDVQSVMAAPWTNELATSIDIRPAPFAPDVSTLGLSLTSNSPTWQSVAFAIAQGSSAAAVSGNTSTFKFADWHRFYHIFLNSLPVTIVPLQTETDIAAMLDDYIGESFLFTEAATEGSYSYCNDVSPSCPWTYSPDYLSRVVDGHATLSMVTVIPSGPVGVPEPTTVALLVAGLAGLAAQRRRTP